MSSHYQMEVIASLVDLTCLQVCACQVDTENTDVAVNQRIGYKSTYGIKGKKPIELDETISFSPEDGKTKLTYKAEYKVPVPVVGTLIEAVFMKMNERMIKTCLNNLKAKME